MTDFQRTRAIEYQHLAFLGAKSAQMCRETGQVSSAIAYQEMAAYDSRKARKHMGVK